MKTCVFVLGVVLLAPTLAADITVHLIPHSHDDAGYRETLVGYYEDRVQHIIDSYLVWLSGDPARRFQQEETVFFEMWWNNRNDTMRNLARSMLANGQLEYIGGGWVMHDEANPDLYSTLTQMTTGREWVQNTLGVKPTIGWHIDPFGASILTPTLYKKLGYKMMVINRIPDFTKQAWKASQSLEFLWDSGVDSSVDPIFTHVLDSHYSTPKLNGITPAEQAASLVKVAQQRAAWYKTGNVLIPFGNDFYFTSVLQFAPMDAILEYLAANPVEGLKFRYSTLSEYADAVAATNTSFPTVSNQDFFPYVACSPCDAGYCNGVPCGTADAYWTGYFAGHPAQKASSRYQDALLRETDSLYALRPPVDDTPFNATDAFYNTITTGRRTSGLLQHHDALPGTSFDYCTISKTQCDCYTDYNNRLQSSASQLLALQGALKGLCLAKNPAEFATLSPDVAAATAGLSPTSTSVVAIAVGNGLLSVRDGIARVTVAEPSSGFTYAVTDAAGDKVASQVIVDDVRGETTLAMNVSVPALGVQVVFVSLAKASPQAPVTQSSTLSNGVVSLDIDANGIHSITAGDTTAPLSLYTYSVPERVPNDSNIFSGTNVYTYVPAQGAQPFLLGSASESSVVTTASGPLVWEATLKLLPWVNVTYTLTAGAKHAIVRPRIGPIPTSVLAQYNASSIVFRMAAPGSTPSFFTDSNFFMAMNRSGLTSPYITGRYGPVSPGILLSDGDSTAVSLTSVRPVGGGQFDGGAEVLLHRRIIDGDARGDDQDVIDTPFALMVGTTAAVSAARHDLALAEQQPLSFHAAPAASTTAFLDKSNPIFAPVNVSLPAGTHLVSMTAMSDATQSSIGLRFQHTPGAPAVSYPFASMLAGPPAELVQETSCDFLTDVSAPVTGVDFPKGTPAYSCFLFNRLI